MENDTADKDSSATEDATEAAKAGVQSRPAASAPASASPLAGVLLFFFGLWGLVAPYASTALGYVIPVPARVEFVDHVVPGVIIIGVAVWAIFSGRLSLVMALAATLSGFWMTMTHLPAIRDGFGGLISLQAALIHSLPGLAILAIAGAASVKAYKSMPD